MNIVDLRHQLRSPWPVLDCHVHPFACFGFREPRSPEEDAALLVASGERARVTKMVLFSLHESVLREPTMAECREANDYALAMKAAAPDTFVPLCYVNPMYPHESVEEIERCVGIDRMCGVKLWVARRATDPGLDPILEKAVSLDVPVLQHAWIKTTGNLVGESFPADVAALARRHPEAKIIMAHLYGCGLRGIEDCPNISIDTSGGDPENEVIEQAVARIGHDRGRLRFGCADSSLWCECGKNSGCRPDRRSETGHSVEQHRSPLSAVGRSDDDGRCVMVTDLAAFSGVAGASCAGPTPGCGRFVDADRCRTHRPVASRRGLVSESARLQRRPDRDVFGR